MALLGSHPEGKIKDTLMQGQWSLGPDSVGDLGGKLRPVHDLNCFSWSLQANIPPLFILVGNAHPSLPTALASIRILFRVYVQLTVQSRDLNHDSARVKGPHVSPLCCGWQEWK